jgi:Resolvase, N terminal domain
MIVGYARVSTDGQSLEAQRAALTQAGATQVFAEKVSGAVTDRKQLAKAIATLGQGDVLLVTRLDRACEIDPRSAQRARRCREGRCRLPIPRGQLGRHHHTARPVDVDRARGAGGVRAKLDPCTDQRRPHPRQGKGSEVRPQAGADPTPTGRSSCAKSSGGELGGDCSELRGLALHHQPP